MYKKITVMLTALALIAASSYIYSRMVPSPQRQPLPQSENRQGEDPLAKTEREGIEENINGTDLEEDFRLTRDLGGEEKRILSLSQEQQKEMLNKVGSKKMNTVLEEYHRILPAGINNRLQYTGYDITYDYFLVTAENGTEIREKPTADSPVVGRVNNLDKVSLLQRVESDMLEGSNIWYRVACNLNNQTIEGYLHSGTGIPRAFRFDKMLAAVNELRQQLAQGELHFIRNYKNQNGTPPQKGNTQVDEHGYRFYHSAPAYEQASTASNFRYIPDGMLVRVLEDANEFFHVNVPSFGGDFFVPKQYVDQTATLSRLNHVVVVDRNQQNQAAFEVTENGLNLISYTLCTTGLPGDYSFETTLGSYKVLEKKERFEYLQKGSEKIAGYAPFAVRFTGGAYIHGVPVNYEEKNGERVDPGTIEYLHTIGTFPRSNMCVRNFTSHAQFLYNWMDSQNGAVIVID
ncbi:MAG TPA: L,D-transpeptidase family protein [Clostridia bacterium]|nr:L,D-transpeptidase family protein [Clostridia bacterium]